MVFSSTAFVFFFLPLALAGYFLLRSMRSRNIWLLIVSLFFYTWGEACFLPILLYSIFINYISGRLIGYLRSRQREGVCKAMFIAAICLNLLNLGYWKYMKFIVQIMGDVTGKPFALPDIVLPIGISFFTFQGMSYVIDVYRNEAQVQKNLIKLGLYVALFPQLIAGPIVRYSDIERQLDNRSSNVENLAAGIRLFTVGLAKKAILSNSIAVTADKIFSLSPYQNEPIIAWAGLFCYSFQLYFDFSGYSDMAVGLGKMFGFQFVQNFNYPFISRSCAEIWKRWHISLSSWFRDYVYIPLGGSRRGNVYIHLLCVFTLTGLWHGASWNYVVWGIFWGVCIVTEKFLAQKCKWKIKIPRVLSWMSAMFLWLISMVIFRTETLEECALYFRSLFGILPLKDVGFSWLYYFHTYEIFIIVCCLIAAAPTGKNVYLWVKGRLPEWGAILENVLTLALLGIAAIYVVTGTYNPFIYFQF